MALLHAAPSRSRAHPRCSHPRAGSALAALALLALTAGCGGNLGRAKSAYVQGRYLEATERLQADEPQLTGLSETKQAEYGLYRGLSLVMLGDYRAGQEWLEFAMNVERRSPGTLNAEQKLMLGEGFSRARYALTPRPPSPYPTFAMPATRLPTPAQARE